MNAIVRPPSLRSRIVAFLLDVSVPFAALLRALAPIARLPFTTWYLIARADDVHAVFRDDAAFTVTYGRNMRVLLGNPPKSSPNESFVLAMGDTPYYRTQLAALHGVVPAADIPALAHAAQSRAAALIAAATTIRRLEVVAFARTITFDLFCPFFGVPRLRHSQLETWLTRLFEFQFTYINALPAVLRDETLRRDAETMAPELHEYIDALIGARRGGGNTDDVLGRCLDLQARGDASFAQDWQIRTALIGLLVAIPQWAIILPRALEQLLRRPDALGAAKAASQAGPDAVAPFLFEAMRFDPLAPGLLRVAASDTILAPGTPRARTIPAGSQVVALFASAMRDPRRVARPHCFDPGRSPGDTMHFGLGLHECFAERINRAILPVMLHALLSHNIARAPGAAGRLHRSGFFPEQLTIMW